MGLPLLGRFRTGLVQGYKIVFFTNDIRGIFFTFPLISTFCYISKEIHLAGFAKLCLSKIAAIRPETLRLKCKIIAPEEPNNHTQQSKASKNADRGRKKKKKKRIKDQSNGRTFNFYNGYFEHSFWTRKTETDEEQVFKCRNVFANPVRYRYL